MSEQLVPAYLIGHQVQVMIHKRVKYFSTRPLLRKCYVQYYIKTIIPKKNGMILR
jgi:hypothetical protein